jgi:ABC-type hemin transport system ATPase subunit
VLPRAGTVLTYDPIPACRRAAECATVHDVRDLLARFVTAFRRGLEGEIAAMREASGASELALTRGEELGPLRYGFELGATETLQRGTTGTLRSPGGEQRITVERCDDTRLTLVATQPIDLDVPHVLVVAPWFLYDRLLDVLASLDVDRHGVPLALRLFGKPQQPSVRIPTPLRCDHAGLDASQLAAVQLCSESDLAFVWGPPGTGKTRTLTHVIEELLAQGQRILLASTTNAAIDQILAKLSATPWFAAAVEAGTIVRLGRSPAETFGTELRDHVERAHGMHRTSLERLRGRVGEVIQQLRFARALLEDLAPALGAQQSLFNAPAPRLRDQALSRVFSLGLAEALASQAAVAQRRALEQRIARLDRVRVLAKARIAALTAADRDLEQRLLSNARVVLCTLTNAYLVPAMAEQRFDVLIAEEAGMATLPPLFYAACLCRHRAIVVGDPRQLPPITQSNDEVVRRTIGRNVFDVTIPDPARAEDVAMLQVQYRMHPAIGALVGRLFYDDRLIHAADPQDIEAITARAPFPGVPVVVVDIRGTSCERTAHGSRVNRGSAERTAELALEAVRADTGSISIITPYAAQVTELRKLLAARGIADQVECNTIHRFQGRECDTILIDLVDAAPLRPSALVNDAPNLLNVSISRARGKLVIVADVAYFEAALPDGLVTRLLRAASAVTSAADHATSGS